MDTLNTMSICATRLVYAHPSHAGHHPPGEWKRYSSDEQFYCGHWTRLPSRGARRILPGWCPKAGALELQRLVVNAREVEALARTGVAFYGINLNVGECFGGQRARFFILYDGACASVH
eukprot:scaffold250539_cov21-Tisochrysis_lutea.AAC.1